MSSLPSQSTVFFYNVPEAVIFFRSDNYYQYLRYGDNVIRGEENLPLLFAGIADYVLVDQKFDETTRLEDNYEESARFDKYTLYRKTQK